ncbi:gp16 family protein [Sphingomonas sp. ERG5]|uniref:gp16 family protein n=1 Tax=Sphingomonas sp. ERG5 TaxID=1381597 RepID=UPI00054BC9F2|nr:regulatory protein GemA [Sphingomonas sp. ERG5]
MTAAARPAQFDQAARWRRSMIAKVHIAKSALGLDDDLYLGILLDVAGRRSSADCTADELIKLIKHFESRGFTAKAKSGAPRPADKPFAMKARAMWISLHHLGAIDNPSDKALEAFASRQLKVAKMQWADEALSYRLIEGLKKMAERAGWSQDLKGVSPNAKIIVLKRRLVEAIVARLKAEELIPADWDLRQTVQVLGGTKVELMVATAIELDVIAGALGRKLRGEVM